MIGYIVIVTDTTEDSEFFRFFSCEDTDKVRKHIMKELDDIGCQYFIGDEFRDIFYTEKAGIEHKITFTLDQIERVNF